MAYDDHAEEMYSAMRRDEEAVQRLHRQIGRTAAEIYTNKDWHRLSAKERELILQLEEAGYIVRNKPVNGLVGAPPQPA